MRITANTIELPDEILSEMWNSFDWDSAEQKVLKWQKLLSIASFKNHKEEMKKLSIRIVSSIEAKALAVHKVSEVLKSSPGIDGERWIKASDKMRAAISLSHRNYKSKPYKRFVISDSRSSKERRIGIPSMYDRTMQVLYCMALEPISEATADRKSFAFRKGRSALYYLFSYIRPPRQRFSAIVITKATSVIPFCVFPFFTLIIIKAPPLLYNF